MIMRLRATLTWTLVLITLGGAGACSSESGGDGTGEQEMTLTFTPVETSPGAIASFEVHWGPNLNREGQLRAPLTSYTSVGLANDPANPVAYYAAGNLLEGAVILTNFGTTALDEPRVVVTSVTGGCDPNCADIQFLNSDFGTGNNLGAAYAYPDVSAAGGADDDSRRYWSVRTPAGDSFSFTADVIAENSPINVSLDADDDFFNGESGEPGGGDCDDGDDTEYPGGDACPNPGGCSSSCSSSVSGCCEETCGFLGVCNPTCAAGNECYFSGFVGLSAAASCQAGSTCSLSQAIPIRAAISSCAGAACDLRCFFGGALCVYPSGSCDDSACSLTCDSQSRCLMRTCTGDSTCRVDCGAAEECGLLSCENSSASCMVDCGSSPDCTLDCDIGDPIDCGGGVLVCPGTPCP